MKLLEKLNFLITRSQCPKVGGIGKQGSLDILAYQYDIVCNGIELSSGAIRNHLQT